jgi:hypothetical protein
MPDENGGEDIQGKPDSELIGTPSPPTKPRTTQNETTTEKLEKDIKRGEWWLIRIGVATLVINTIIACIYYQQLTQMRLATEASTQAVDLANDTLEYNNSNFDRAMQRTIDQTIASMNAANATKSAADTAASTLKEIQRTEMADISIRDVEVLVDGGKDGPLSFFVNFENSGTTATKHLSITPVCSQRPINFSEAIKRQRPLPAVIGPRSNLRQFSCEAVPQYALSSIYLVFGKVEYGDILGVKHTTEYCWELVGLPSKEHPSMQQCTYTEDAIHNCQDEDCPVD